MNTLDPGSRKMDVRRSIGGMAVFPGNGQRIKPGAFTKRPPSPRHSSQS
jgi:hypothetical protein